MDTTDSLPFKQQLKHIEAFVFDNDGVFTNGTVFLMPGGEQVRTASTRDGYAVQHATKCGLRIAMISGGRSEEVVRRMNGLGVTEVIMGASEKLGEFEKLCQRWGLEPEQICYMGDDIPDYEVMRHVGLPVCPMDAAHEISEFAQYISPRKGGEGCVRDVIEKVLRLHDYWLDYDRQHHATETELE